MPPNVFILVTERLNQVVLEYNSEIARKGAWHPLSNPSWCLGTPGAQSNDIPASPSIGPS